MLTGDTLPTKGRAYICGHDVQRELGRVRQLLGYCPQVDPILELMTGRETLLLFARLRGCTHGEAAPRVTRLLEQVSLTAHADRIAGSYSGGNKRKLSLAVALIGVPAVIFLDEPSSGMDPLARRHMWDLIMHERSQRAVVLTSHSMEECEALCTRIGIMRNGQLRCLGGQQHLKSRFGTEYTLEVRCATHANHGGEEGAASAESAEPKESESESSTAKAIRTLLPGATLSDSHGAALTFSVPSDRFALADVFEAMEQHKEALCVQDYACSQPRLEEIFLALAADNDPRDATATESTEV